MLSQMMQMLQRETLTVPVHDQKLYGLAAPINSITLVSGWDDATTIKLKAAVNAVVEANPLLGGKLMKQADGTIVCQSHAHDEFVVEIEGPADFSAPPDLSGKIVAMQKHLEKCFAWHTIGQPLETGGPLFRIILMRWRGSASHPQNEHTAAYMVELSHLIGDGATYYKVIGLIDDAVNGRAVKGLRLELPRWKRPCTAREMLP